ncbi:COX assembly mitochondrial protein homolog [Gigantopelta aegis]|uniref:COX assembly mitochondrial protein homolog n=1 Tax=Gigantopelta aegis TaxID=1735272 RepID=UPI001B88C6FE|nr:COX assembly mitochondrial protein homolog [Gigantopelta aegis]
MTTTSMADGHDDSISEEHAHVLRGAMGGGPKGLGDPDDKRLRQVEREVLIPQKMKFKARKEICAEPIRIFGACAKEMGLLMPFRCRKEAKQLKHCLKDAYADKEFAKRCEEEYLQERSEYRRTGIKMKHKKVLEARLQ